MNEIEFRKQCVIDPHTQDPDFQKALENPEFESIWKEYVLFEAQLAEAIRLPDSIDTAALKQIPAEHGASGSGGGAFWARPKLSLAASFVAAMVVAVGLLFQPTPALSESMMDHLYDHMEVTHVRTLVADKKLNALLDQFGAELVTTEAWNIRHISECEIAKTKSLHMVFDGASGPVTLFYVPHVDVERVSMMGRNEFHGILFSHGEGTIGIIGVMDEDLLALKATVESAIAWHHGKQA